MFNEEAVSAADSAIAGAIKRLLSLGEQQAVVGIAPAGAGKSYAIGSAVEALRRARLRVAVATPTNEQAFALVSDIAKRLPREQISYLPKKGLTLPDGYAQPNVVSKDATQANGDGLLVGTLSKLGDAFSRGTLETVDVLLIDEAYQADAVKYYMIGGLAPRHLLVGDSGQLSPFSTAPEGDRWRGLDEDPLLTAVEVLLRNHAETVPIKIPISRRLDPRAVKVARAFYPNHEFDAAVLPDVRQLKLSSGANVRQNRVVDHILDRASADGWAHIELPDAAVLLTDRQTVELIVHLVSRLFERSPMRRCEVVKRPQPLEHGDVAIAVSHNDQKTEMRAALSRARLGGVEVNTANKLQGLTFQVVIAWHPLAGLVDVDPFHLDPGRLCVMLTRHRHACIVIGRAGDRMLVDGIPPATPSYVGWDANRSLDGWFAHEAVLSVLGEYQVGII